MNKKNRKTLVSLSFVVVGMFGLAFAAVPLYDLFCKVTGFGGTPQTEVVLENTKIGTKNYEVFFNADVAKDLNWHFKPEQRKVDTVSGKRNLIFYSAKNNSNETIIGTATFNVTPLKAGKYFSKIECFCFTKQKILPGEKINFPVSFYIDSEIDNDPFMQEVTQITLSYSFFRDVE
jgi:cytochrome c oxidase assembly protein subunit 11